MVQDGPRWHRMDPQMVQDGPTDGTGWTHRWYRMDPQMAQDGPTDGTGWTHRWHRMDPQMVQDGPTDGTGWTHRWYRMDPLMAQDGPTDGQHLQLVQNAPTIGTECSQVAKAAQTNGIGNTYRGSQMGSKGDETYGGNKESNREI